MKRFSIGHTSPYTAKVWLLAMLWLGCFRMAVSQVSTNPDGTDIQEIIENNAQQAETESFDYDANIDDLENFKEHPVNLNIATESELADLMLLSPAQISALLNYIRLNGPLISILELQAVPGFDVGTIHRILPYVKVNNDISETAVSAKKLLSKGKVTLLTRYRQIIEQSDGYTRTDGKGYLGKPFGLYMRFRYNYGNRLSYGFTAEKDPGEEFFKGSNKQGLDFYSGHLFLRNFKALKALALGDYEVRLGQGLIMWSGFGFSKSPSVMNVKKEGAKLRPYTSANEFNFMRGAAFTAGKRGFEVTAFTSFKQVDANLLNAVSSDTFLNAQEAFSSFNESGYHRTANEIADRNAVQQLLTGGNFSYNQRQWHIGINAVYEKTFTDYQRALFPYNQFDLNKSWLLNASVDYHWLIRNFHFFGEEGISDNLGYGFVNGALISIDPRVDVSVVHRYYARQFQTLYANAFAEATRPQNENGIYLGVTVRPYTAIRLDGYFDLYKSNWLSYLADAPSWGSDNYLQLTFTPGKSMEMYLRYRFELKKKNQSANDGPLDYLVNDKRQSLRFNIRYKVSQSVTLANRIEWSYYRNGSLKTENGFLIYQDVNFRMLSFPLSFNARLAIFKTDSYNARFYAYESDVLYAFSIPAYYNNGLRWYLTMRYAITRNIDVWIRAAQTSFFDIRTIGSGLDAINGTHKTEIKAQLRLRF